MKNIIKGGLVLSAASMLASCSDSFLEQDPLSFYEPQATYTTEAGLQAALAKCDRSIKEIFMDGNGNVLPMASNYNMSDLGLYAKTDNWGSFQDNFDASLSPTSGLADGGDANAMMRYWNEAYNAIKYANTVLTYIDDVPGLDEKVRDEYKGRAYFHRAYKYYHLVLQYGNVPLVTKLPSSPKRDYHSTSKEAIFEMLIHDLEFAVNSVPLQKDMQYIGMVNKEACMILLAKCYLVTGQFAEAEKMCDELINNTGHSLMTAPFGTFVQSGNPDTWTVERNVMWDLMRGVNVCASDNKEMLMPILNFNAENFTQYLTMRAMQVHWSNQGAIRDKYGVFKDRWGEGMTFNYARTNGYYNTKYDWLRVMGRGIGCFRTSVHFNENIWNYDGEVDWQDLRHNREKGNWIEMNDIKYNNPNSAAHGQSMILYAPADFYGWKVEPEKNSDGTYKFDENGLCIGGEQYKLGDVDKEGKVIEKPLVAKGDLLCSDTIRSWFPTPLWKNYVLDVTAENNRNANQFNGATNGSNGNMYLYRLAEAYLIRAEAKFYQGKAGAAAQDVNVIRQRANAKKMFTTVTIGDIMDERARELLYEEWRQAELCRVSWCLAVSGQPDEWGETYSKDNWDKQEGTDLNGGSYWFKRVTRYNIFNRADMMGEGIFSNGRALHYIVNKRNLFWPVPNSAITANSEAPLAQNYGYNGYDAATPMWTNWEEAVANE